ncbi:UxaA family hydrolase [Anaeromicropila populeti]|uniref:Altronate hydrolase n=1 Tax=Anaeromicropila populeti TaxID=37658 RepID=A0A1I6I8Y9_9FIRM|nr:altronate dehydratase family protein [Anaeromicropila populeti]SFR63217.1 altronate hydrolase [Anaeromicropila populeti]
MQNIIKIHKEDDVAVALKPISAFTEITVNDETFAVTEDIPQGHKVALRDIHEGEKIIKYGYPIGVATTTIKKGSWIHTQNLKTGLGDMLSYQFDPVEPKFTDKDITSKASFQGFRRKDGSVGIRNEIWIIPTVGCVNNVAVSLEKKAMKLLKGTVEDIIAYPHPYGCSQMGEDQESTRRILADLVNHPNAAGVLVLGLGCENSNIDILKSYIGEYDEDRVKFLVCQEVENEIDLGLELIQQLVDFTSSFQREEISASELIIGLKCGGSDGLSGITANPVVGEFSDLLIREGGTTILTEVPEMFGAETLLMNRCKDEMTFDKTVNLINDFKHYFKSHDQTIYENPSPGNKKGGISSLEEKSLGCVQKAGMAVVKNVLGYGERTNEKGLNLLSAPGNDLVASTALAASGAHIVLFTTGRGTPFACPVPTVKIATNSQLATNKNNWIDFNAGEMVEGKEKELLAKELFDFVLMVASGKKVKSEEAGFHDMAIFKTGVTL